MRIYHRIVSTTLIVFKVCGALLVLVSSTRLADRKSSFDLIRERSRLCDLVFGSDKATGVLEIAAPHECRSDPLPQGNGSCHRQELFTGQGEEDAPREALPHVVKSPRRLLERSE